MAILNLHILKNPRRSNKSGVLYTVPYGEAIVKAYEEVRKMLITSILDGTYASGYKIASFRALAKQANTSVQTVSRAITQLIIEGHLLHQPGVGYFVKQRGPISLPPARTIGILVPYIGSETHIQLPFDVRQVLTTVQIELSARNRSTLLLFGFRHREELPATLRPSEAQVHHLEALLIMGFYEPRYLEKLCGAYKVVVALDEDVSAFGVDCAAFNNLSSAITLVQALSAQGSQRIAYVGGPLPTHVAASSRQFYDPCAKERYDGWCAGLQAAGLPFEQRFVGIVAERNDQAAMESTLKLLSDGGVAPDSIVTEFPNGVLRALELRNASGSIPVAGWSVKDATDPAYARMAFRAECDFQELARRSVDVLFRRLEQPENPAERFLVAPPVIDPSGNIWQNPRSPIVSVVGG